MIPALLPRVCVWKEEVEVEKGGGEKEGEGGERVVVGVCCLGDA